MHLEVYSYAKCGTCRKALAFLSEHEIDHTVVPIREQPPTKSELKKMLLLHGGNLRRLFNTSGLDYKRLDLKDKLASMDVDQAIELLSRNGNLVKRPFVLADNFVGLGFNPEQWKKQVANP